MQPFLVATDVHGDSYVDHSVAVAFSIQADEVERSSIPQGVMATSHSRHQGEQAQLPLQLLTVPSCI